MPVKLGAVESAGADLASCPLGRPDLPSEPRSITRIRVPKPNVFPTGTKAEARIAKESLANCTASHLHADSPA